MRHTNIELKVPVQQPDAVEERLRALGATDAGVLVQRDTYFAVADGRLKLREMPSRAELIAYSRDESRPTMESSYSLSPVGNPTIECARLAARHGIRGVVEKSRALWLLGNARIHVDHVAGLGSFLEIEVVDPRTAAEGEALLRELAGALGLDRSAGLRESYIDLLERQTSAS